MAHGAPDNYEVQPKSTVYRLDDMAELAVRLGSPITFHRLGDVIFIDSFENGLERWEKDTYEGMATVKITSKRYKNRGFSCKLISVANIPGYCGIYCGSSFYLGGKIGFEFSFAGDSYGKKIILGITIYDGEDQVSGNILLNTIDRTLAYYIGDSDYTVFETGIKVVQEEYIWNTWKLIVDMDTEEYVKAILNQNVYSLKDISLYKAKYESAPFIIVKCYFQELQLVDTTLYVDDCILTQNEP